MAINLSQFTGSFKGGARPNLFMVRATEGPLRGNTEDLEILGQGASLPAATIGEIIVPYMGRQHKIPGNRTYDTWDLTIINDIDFTIRDAFHDWQETINDPSKNISDSGRLATTGGIFGNILGALDIYGQFEVVQLGTRGEPLKSYTVHNAWPSVVSDIELNWESNDALETFTVTLNYSHWTQGDPAGAIQRAISEASDAAESTFRGALGI
jgi:hypothetical protein